jgi:hypothetical protein
MTKIEIKKSAHPTEEELAAYLGDSLPKHERQGCVEHLASCADCLVKAVSAYETVKVFEKDRPKKRKVNIMKKINIYMVLASISFVLSFLTPRYFLQLLVATLVLGTKWISDSKSTKMLVMIYEAWKRDGEKGASRILETLDKRTKNRF